MKRQGERKFVIDPDVKRGVLELMLYREIDG